MRTSTIKSLSVTALFTLVEMLPAAVYAQSPAAIPDFSGLWARATFGFEPPETGNGPIRNLMRQSDGTEDRSRTVGDFRDPNLKPKAAAVLKRNGETALSGSDYPTPNNQCRPMAPPYILRVQAIQVLQQRDRVILIYAQDHQFREVRLNQPHRANVAPPWHGDSVGHYQGDTLIIDTIGAKIGPAAMVDTYGTPFSENLHVVERYRLVDYRDAQRSLERGLREYGPPVTEQAVAIDKDYRGKGLQVQFTVEDRDMFAMPWSATVTYLRARGAWVENVCAENIHEYYASRDVDVPQARKPDF